MNEEKSKQIVHESNIWHMSKKRAWSIFKPVEGNLQLSHDYLTFTPTDSSSQKQAISVNDIKSIYIPYTTNNNGRIYVKLRNRFGAVVFSLYEKNRTDILISGGPTKITAIREWEEAFSSVGLKVSGLKNDFMWTIVTLILGVLVFLAYLLFIKPE